MKRIRTRILSTLLTVAMVISIVVIAPVVPIAPVQATASINIGDYVRMGSYYGESILWRCVDIDANGPLMLADRILTIKPYDAPGTHKYLDGTTQANPNGYRTSYGSDLWQTSNMRSWLNSSATSGNVTWPDGCPPTQDKVWSGYNDYANEKGFLADGNFSAGDRTAMKSVNQKSLLNPMDATKLNVGGNVGHTYNYSISSVVQNYDTAYYHNVTDKMFLLDVKQVNRVYQNSSTLGTNYYIGKPTQKAVDNSEYKNSGLNTSSYWHYWLRSPYAYSYSGHFVRSVSSDGGVSYYGAYGHGYMGARPAFYLDLQSAIFKSGTGAVGSPYIISGGGSAEPTPKISEEYGEAFDYSPTVYSKELAKRAARYSMLAYDDIVGTEDSNSWSYKKIPDSERKGRPYALTDRLGSNLTGEKFMDFWVENYADKNPNNVGYVFGRKKVWYKNALKTEVVVVVRGTDTEEWKGNMDITGTDYNASFDVHDSFWQAKEELKTKLKDYLRLNGISDAVLFVTGHSRGAAVANLVANDLNTDKFDGKVGDVFCYTFATPNVSRKPNLLSANIFNFCFRDDFVPQVPLSKGGWDYGKHGKTFGLLSAQEINSSNSAFYYEVGVFYIVSDASHIPDFNSVGTSDLISHVWGKWQDVRSYYWQSDTDTITLYDFFRNRLAPLAINKGPIELYNVYNTNNVFAPIRDFFVGGTGAGWNKHYIIDTHSPFTYYSAIKNGAFDAYVASEIPGFIPILNATLPTTTSAPANPNAVEVAKLKTFAQQGDNLTALGWNLNDTSTWTGVLWNLGATNSVVSVDFSYKNLTGTLNLNGFANLISLNASGNALTEIDIGGCTAMTDLDVMYNKLTSVSLSGLSALQIVKVSWNELTALDVSSCINIEKLSCDNNNISALSLAANTKLTDLYCASNALTALNLSTNILLTQLSCGQNYLDIQAGSAVMNTIDVVKGRTGAWVSYDPQKFSANPTFNASDLAKLTTFANQGQNLTKLTWDLAKPQDMFGVTWVKVGAEYRVKNISVDNLALTGSVDFSGMPYLVTVSCNSNTFSSVNVSNCPVLTNVACASTGITSLNISTCPLLFVVDCQNNALDTSTSSALLTELNNVSLRENAFVLYDGQKILADKSQFNASEYSTLRAFASAAPNAAILNWNLDKPGEWSGVVWEQVSGTYRVKSLDFTTLDVSGALDLSGFASLTDLKLSSSKVTSVALPSGLTEIKEKTFYDCAELTSVTIPSSVTKVGKDAFYNCTKLVAPKLPSGLTSIENGAFAWCASQTSVDLPANLKSLGAYAFSDCAALSSVKVPVSVTTIGEAAFNGSAKVVLKVYLGSKAKDFAVTNKIPYVVITPAPVAVTSVKLNKTFAALKVTQTLQITATVSPSNAANKSGTWSSSNTKIATVSSNGKITAKGPGTATITVTTVSGAKKATCKVTVTQPVISIKLNKTSLSILKGKIFKLIPTINPNNASNKKVTWKSNNVKIATVSSTGMVKGIKKGSCSITVVTVDGKKSAKCKVVVK